MLPKPLTINDPDVERLARELAEATGEPVSAAVAAALRERLQRARAERGTPGGRPPPERAAEVPRFRSVEEIQAYVVSLPVARPRPAHARRGRRLRRAGAPDLTPPDRPRSAAVVVDTSALVAILLGEPEALRRAAASKAAPAREVGAATYVEAVYVMGSRHGAGGIVALDALLAPLDITIASMTARRPRTRGTPTGHTGRAAAPSRACSTSATATATAWRSIVAPHCSARARTSERPPSPRRRTNRHGELLPIAESSPRSCGR